MNGMLAKRIVPRKDCHIWYIAVVFCLLATIPISSSAADKGADKDKTCLDCHPKYYKELRGKFNHKPFEERKCEDCHHYHGFRNKQELVTTVMETCTSCHLTIEDMPKESLHYPILEDNSCNECHEPHSADNKDLLKVPGAGGCFECHDEPPPAGKGIHQPYADSSCFDCHNPHGSLFAGLLQLPSGYICLGCHDGVLDGYGPDEMHSGDELSSCERCHDGHESDYPDLLQKEVTDLCLKCHDELAERLETIPKHSILEDEDCLVCHLPHYKKDGQHLVDKQRELCFTCHSDIEERLKAKFVHSVVLDEDCSLCHDPHAGVLNDTQAELCANCHDVEDDDYLSRHAGLTPTKCSGCHDPHGSGSEKMIRQVVHPPFDDDDCGTCHEDTMTRDELTDSELCLACHDIDDSPDVHSRSILAENSCVACHNPHVANRESLLIDRDN